LHGHLPFFTQFLEGGNLFPGWIKDCPLAYASNNAPGVRDVLGTIVLSVLSGHRRYCHSAALYGDQLAAGLFRLPKIISHDSLSRGLKKIDEDKAEPFPAGRPATPPQKERSGHPDPQATRTVK